MPIYEYLCSCGKSWESYSTLPHQIMFETCPKCGGTGERVYSLAAVKIFNSFTTTNIIEDGTPVKVTGASQLRQLESEHGVKMADGPPPQTKFPEPA